MATISSTGYRPATVQNHCGAQASAAPYGGEHGDQCVMFIGLTPCCGSTGKGSEDSSTYHVCRTCYREVAAPYGSNGWASIRQAAADAKCPTPDACADWMLSRLEEASTPEALR